MNTTISKLKPYSITDTVPRVPGVYAFLNTSTAECYVGSTKDFKIRRLQHVNMVNRREHESRLVQESWDKHPNSFIFVLIEVQPDIEIRLDREQYWIDTLNSALNICRNSRSPKGRIYMDETLVKMSLAHTGRKATEETIVKLRYAQQNRSAETIEKTAAAHRGMKRSDLTRQRISESKKGLVQSESQVHNRAAKVKKPLDQYTKSGEFLKTWLSAVDVGNYYGCTDVCISQCARGITKSAQGFVWKFNKTE